MANGTSSSGGRADGVIGGLGRGARSAVRSGVSWASRRGLDTGPHREENLRWWAIVDEAMRLSVSYSFSYAPDARVFERSAAAFARGLAARQATRARPIARGLERLVGTGGSKDKRRALDLARDARVLGEHAFAERILKAILAADPSSPLTWAYLSDVHRATGNLEEAHRARARHLELAKNDSEFLTRVDAAFEDLTEALRARSTQDADPAAAATALYADLVHAREAGTGAHAAPGMVRSQLANVDVRGQAVRAAEALLSRAETYGTVAPADDAALARAYVRAHQQSDHPRIDAAAVGTFEVMDVSGFREYVTGKRVCLIANSETVAGSGLGERIDGYDVVVRFNSFRIDPAHTGTRTDVHALIHLHDFNWDVPVDVRVVFSGDSVAWRRSIVAHLEPSAQKHLTDETLRWPVLSEQLVDDRAHREIPTSGFNMMRLLDFLDVSEAIDLIGFDFYESGAYRLDDAMKLPIVDVHDYTAEKAWVMAHATSVDGPIISLR